MVEPIFAKQDFAMLTGKPKTYTHTSAGSGKQVFIHFCDTCGTKLFLSFERFADIIGVYGGTFDDPDWFDVTPENSKHIFLGVARSGTIVPSGFNTFIEHATENDGTPIEPTVFASPQVMGDR